MKYIQSHWDLDSDTQTWKTAGSPTAFSLFQATLPCCCSCIPELQPQVTNTRAPAHSTDLHKAYLKPAVNASPYLTKGTQMNRTVVPLSGVFALKGKARVGRITPGALGHAMPCYPRLQPGGRNSSQSTTHPDHGANISAQCGLTKLPACTVSGWGRGCGVALNTGGNSPRQGGLGEKGRQPCVDQALRVLL